MFGSFLLTAAFFSGCKDHPAALPRENHPLTSEAEIVFYRNYEGPIGKGYAKIGVKEQLGKAVYGMPPTTSWQALLTQVAPEEAGNNFPVVYAEERLFPDGKSYLVAAQLDVRFIGDGGWNPGPLICCKLFTIDRSNPDKPLLIWKGSEPLGTLQNSKVHRGVADPRNAGAYLVTIDEENGSELKSRTLRFVTFGRSEIRLEKLGD
ncbi:MAG: hypothetical protein CFE26_10945 [Verrucomicrobiales bacterium VVV1]|nr:MAG: hypothetical protein CFE26_10945 [Verrucomicrobiales bacterium VVV1]